MGQTQILVVEDERIIAAHIEESLKALGYGVSAVVSSGEEAVRKAEENRPDLVLMDIVLGSKVNGIEAATQIFSRFDIPVVYLTAYADEQTVERAKISEPFGYIVKPFNDRELHTIIEIALYKHEMEKKLKEREEWLATTLVSIGDAVIATNTEGCVTFMNPVAQSLTGWKEEEAIGRSVTAVFNIMNEKTRTPVQDPVTKVLQEGVVVGLANHTVLIAKDGTERPIDDSGAPIKDDKGKIKGVVLVFRDISERKEAGDALRQSEERYRALFEQTSDAIYITTTDGRIVDVNQSALEMFGYARKEMMGADVSRVYMNPDDRRRFQENIEETGSVKDYGVKLRKKDGTVMDCLLTSTIWRSADGGALGYQGIIRDITEHRRLEAQLRQAQKMEAIGTLAGGIAHDFNNLLMGIQGNVSLILMGKHAEHPDYERLSNIDKQIQSGARLTSLLLGYARKGKYMVEPIGLNQLVGEIADAFGRTRKDIIIQRKLEEELFPVEADRGQMEQVLWNLYANAADAMPGGGNLVLETRNVTYADIKSDLYKANPGRYVLLRVADTGIGMDKRTTERIFDPFFTTKERGQGTGLGLASAYGIIKSHGGYIEAESKKGQGTTFSICLPASEKVISEAVVHDDTIVKGNETVLLVDDEEAVREVSRDMLKAMGYTVLVASDGQEAMDLFQKNRDDIDLVLLDVVMPHMGGAETYKRLKGINPDVKVLLLSGYTVEGSQAAEVLEHGCDSFIQKPFNMRVLSGKIREILDNK